MSTETGCFYIPLGEERFRATELTATPWGSGSQHGGPPAALLGRALESDASGEGLASNAPGRGPVEHRLRVVEANPDAVRKVACELSLAAAYIEHPGEALGDKAPSDQLVNVSRHRMAAKHRACEAQAAGVLVVVGENRLGWVVPGGGIF